MKKHDTSNTNGASNTGSTPTAPTSPRKTTPTDKLKQLRIYSIGEEIANSVTHGVGALLGIAALVLMIIVSVIHGGGLRLAAALVFGITLILEYTASTFYHALRPPRAKQVFKVLDHASIYLLIAGTYTPFCLLSLANSDGSLICILVWALAGIGIAVEAFWVFRPRWVSVLVYLIMGWIIVIKGGTLFDVLPTGGMALLLAGGLCYTLGTIFYILKKVPYMHSIWHLWVLAGSTCHVLCVLLFVI